MTNIQKKHDSSPKESNNNETKGVKTLLGDPKTAIIKLSLPMIAAMSLQTLYNLVDAIWVSGLGADALAAVGFVFPFFFIAMAIANGLGIGGGSAISRRIGSQDKTGADQVAVHTIILMTIIAVLFTFPVFILAETIFSLMGAGPVTPLSTEYARIVSAASIIIFFSFIANAILRSEGDSTRAMIAMAIGAVLNIILDPIFIYILDLGVAGAAWATVVGMSVASLILAYWLFFKKNTYVSFSFHNFRFQKPIIRDILHVGIPASFQQVSMAIMMIIMTVIIAYIADTNGVAVFTVGWRVVTIATLPLIGFATGVVSVTGAAYGAKEYKKLNTSFLYAVKLGLIVESIIAVFTFILAPEIAAVFTQVESAAIIADDITAFLRIVCIFYPGVAFGMLSSAMFQGIGKGFNALWLTILRTLLLTPPLAILFSTQLNLGLEGIWWGMVVGFLTASITAFIWGKASINRLLLPEKKEAAVE